MAWLNSDGLYIKYGQEEGEAGNGGQFGTDLAGVHIVEFEIPDMTALSVTEEYILDDNTFIPSGYMLEKVEVIVKTAVTGANALLCVGLVERDRTTEVDFDGFIVDAAVATLAAEGNIVEFVQGSTAHGALVGDVLATGGYVIAWEGDANAFTAGAIRIRLHLRKQ